MKPYKEVEQEVFAICKKHPDCWYNNATTCPFWPVCGTFKDEEYPSITARTEAFEAAIAARYNELKGE